MSTEKSGRLAEQARSLSRDELESAFVRMASEIHELRNHLNLLLTDAEVVRVRLARPREDSTTTLDSE